MNRIFVILTMLLIVVAPMSAEDDPKLTAVLNSKSVEFPAEVRAKLVDSSLRLLATCGYRETKGVFPRFTQTSHLHFTFSPARQLDLRIEPTLKLDEMVLTLPLSSGAFWIRSGETVLYLSKFDSQIADEIRTILKEAQR